MPSFELIDTLVASAERFETPCGEGQLVWRRWGEGTPVILVHGGSGSWTHWLKTIPALARQYEVWAVDLPGLGESAMPDEPYTPATCGRVLADGIRKLIPAERRPQLTAFSFGAHVSSYAAIELGDWLGSFIITGSAALGLPYHELKFAKERDGMSKAERLDVHRLTLSMLMFADPENIDDQAVHIQATNVRNSRFRSRKFAPSAEIRDNLPKINAPVRAIWGEKDATALPSPEARLAVIREHHPSLPSVVIPGAGHWAMYETPVAFNSALLDMLSMGSGPVLGSA